MLRVEINRERHTCRYVLGSASQYNGAELVQESNNNVVVVIIQYRLGLFGKRFPLQTRVLLILDKDFLRVNK